MSTVSPNDNISKSSVKMFNPLNNFCSTFPNNIGDCCKRKSSSVDGFSPKLIHKTASSIIIVAFNLLLEPLPAYIHIH